MKILVTGSNGFIGSYLVNHLYEQGHELVCCDLATGDLKDPNYVATLPDVELIYHLAMVNNTGAFYTTPYTILENSTQTLHNILKRYKGIPIVYTSSSETYAGGLDKGIVDIPTDEQVALCIDDIQNTRWCYASGKIVGEAMVVAAQKEFETPYQIIRYHNVYGPGQKNHFLPEFIDRVQQGVYELYGYENTRSFCYVEDAVRATSLIAKEAPWNEIYHVGSDNEYTIKQVADLILDKLSINEDIVLYNDPPGSVKRRCPDISKIKKLGYKPNVDLSDGIDKILEKDYGIKN